MAWKTANSMKALDNIFLCVLSALIFITVFTNWTIKHFRGEIWKSQKLTTRRFYCNKYMFLLVTVIKSLPLVVMQRYNYPKRIWMKQSISFACSNYRCNWQLTDNFCLHLSEPSHMETRKKRIVNQIMTTESWCTINSVNCFTSSPHQPLDQGIKNVIKNVCSMDTDSRIPVFSATGWPLIWPVRYWFEKYLSGAT